MPTFKDVVVPANGQKITISNGKLNVPDRPILPFIEGDGTGPDIWRASVRVFDAAVEKAFGGKKKIAWMEVFAGEKSFKKFNNWLPDETVPAFQEYLVGIKGPLTTPVGGGIRSLNVALRQMLDLYVCLRPVRYFTGVPSPVKRPEKVDMVIFRENTEDIYAGIEYAGGIARSAEDSRFPDARNSRRISRRSASAPQEAGDCAGSRHRRATDDRSGGSRHRHQAGQQARHRAADSQRHRVRHQAQAQERDACPQGEHHEVHRRRLPRLGLRPGQGRLRRGRNRRRPVVQDPRWQTRAGIVIKDAIADITLQQVLTRPEDFDVIATLNLNGDYLSDALAAQVGGIGIAPGGNINYVTGHAIFEATHGTAPKYADQDVVNPGSVILSGVMMFEYLGWQERRRPDRQVGLEKAIAAKTVTYDFARLMEGATKIKCSEFANEMIKHMG